MHGMERVNKKVVDVIKQTLQSSIGLSTRVVIQKMNAYNINQWYTVIPSSPCWQL